MELLLLVGPSAVALVLIYFAWERARSKNGVKASPLRLLASYLLLLPAFAVGSCWGILGHAGFGNSGPRLLEACSIGAIALAGITIFYLVRCVRSAPASDVGDAMASPDRRGLAVLGIVVAFALTIALLGAAWLG